MAEHQHKCYIQWLQLNVHSWLIISRWPAAEYQCFTSWLTISRWPALGVSVFYQLTYHQSLTSCRSISVLPADWSSVVDQLQEYQHFISWMIVSFYPVNGPSVFQQILLCLQLWSIERDLGQLRRYCSQLCTPRSGQCLQLPQTGMVLCIRIICRSAPDWPSLYNRAVWSPLPTNSKRISSLDLIHKTLAINSTVYGCLIRRPFLSFLIPPLLPKRSAFP
jgi:hypothetical protein